MTGYTKLSLADVCESVRYGYTASAIQESVGPHFLRITDIVPDSINWDSVPYCEIDEVNKDRFSLQQGDIVVARTGATVGYAKLIRDEIDAVFASYLVRFRVDTKVADPGFVGRLVESFVYKDFVKSQVGGAAQPNANAQVLGSFKLQLPTKPEQARISSILSAYDNLIENNNRRIQLLEESARLLSQEWFVRLRFPGYEHTRIVEGVPEGWEKKKMMDVCDSIGGGTPDTSKTEYWEDGSITWIIPTDITRNDYLVLLDSEKKITELGLKNSSAKLLPSETILMTSRASVGFFGLIDKEACTNQGFISIIPKAEHLRMYLLHNLMSRREEIIGLAKGTTYKEINKTTFRTMDIIIPNEMLLKQFYDFSYNIIRHTRLLKKQTVNLKAARDLLLPRLMSGEIVV